jgi:NAD(P)H-flavin reductase
MSELLTESAPRAAHPPVQRVVEVSRARPVGSYVELTLDAPEIAERTEPGQFVAFAVGGPTSANLLRRSIAIAAAADGAVTVVVAPHGPGSTWLAGLREGDTVDVVGPLGRPYPMPSGSQGALLVGGGYGAAALIGLAGRLRDAGSPVVAICGAATSDRLSSVDELAALGEVIVTTDDGSAGRQGLVTDVMAQVLGQVAVVYACGPMPMLRAVADAATSKGIPSYVAVEESMACGIGVCMTCVLPVVGEDGRTRFSRSCTEGPVFGGDRVRFADVGALPWDVVGADAMGVVQP